MSYYVMFFTPEEVEHLLNVTGTYADRPQEYSLSHEFASKLSQALEEQGFGLPHYRYAPTPDYYIMDFSETEQNLLQIFAEAENQYHTALALEEWADMISQGEA